ncbi:hypothetical protein PVAND_016398 [Polypedilum vanderplanki]|uniref:Leucine-rich repeat containing protein n=1 Tax=Polypedilum vanderplanki TaxID=319348 RepID=A0A9J6BFH4_POLVA|nr:hypothetical protein PVAND_016398 [Polypedilum vanderplanki]
MEKIDYDVAYVDSIQNPGFVLLVYNFNLNHQKITSIQLSRYLIDNIRYVMFREKTVMPTFPTELAELLPHLVYIGIIESGLEKITKEDLKIFPNLKFLTLKSNRLKTLPNDLFIYTPQISCVNFAHNQISYIGKNIFDNCKDLIVANFKNNKNINVSYSKYKMKIEELKEIFERDCQWRPKSLKQLTEDSVISTIKKENIDELLSIAKCCGLRKLLEETEKFNKIIL